MQPPEPMSHDDFRQTPRYAALCAEYDIDPALGWDAETCASLDDAAEFLTRYERARQETAAWTPELAAAWLEAFVFAAEMDGGPVQLLTRYANVVIVQARDRYLAFTCTPADPAAVGTALTRAHINDTPLS